MLEICFDFCLIFFLHLEFFKFFLYKLLFLEKKTKIIDSCFCVDLLIRSRSAPYPKLSLSVARKGALYWHCLCFFLITYLPLAKFLFMNCKPLPFKFNGHSEKYAKKIWLNGVLSLFLFEQYDLYSYINSLNK